jgi:peptidyl-tRNA hydrolase, PTH1 family
MLDRFLIVGLGNPGRAYTRNRHNLGFMAVSALADELSLAFGKTRSSAKIAEGEYNGRRLILAQPQRYMNRSGESVAPLMAYFQIEPDHLLVIVDDADLPLGAVRLRKQGSAGGHNGIKSIIAHLGSSEFARLRLGMGRPASNGEMVDFVLSDFDKKEMVTVKVVLAYAVTSVLTYVTDGIDAAMNRHNTATAPDPSEA